MPNNPRPNAKVNVKLIESEQVKVHSNMTSNMIYAAILKSQDLYTSNQDEYKTSLSPVQNNDKANENTPRVPKYFIIPSDIGPSITLIGNSIIASPATPFFNEFPAALNDGDSGQYYDIVSQSSGEWSGESVGSASIRTAGRQGNTIGKQADAGGVGLGTGGGVVTKVSVNANTTAHINTWSSIYFEERIGGLFTTRKDVLEKEITSNFDLQTNQPFSFKFKLFDFAPEQHTVIKSKGGNNPFKDGVPSVDIIWGGNIFKIVYYQDGGVELFYKGNSIGHRQNLPLRNKDKSNGVQITVYPLGNYIYVYSGVPTTEATLNNWYAKFNLKEPVKAQKSPVTLVFKCGEGHFNFSAVVHPTTGTIISPLISSGYIPDRQIVTISYIGKFGVGARPNPIGFPDINDKEKFYNYLAGNCLIDYVINPVNAGTYSLTLNLQVLNSLKGFDNLRTQIETAIKSIQKTAAQEFLAFANQLRTPNEAVTNVTVAVKESFVNPQTGAKVLDGQIWGDGVINHTLDSSASQSFNPTTELFSSSGPIGTLVGGVKTNLVKQALKPMLDEFFKAHEYTSLSKTSRDELMNHTLDTASAYVFGSDSQIPIFNLPEIGEPVGDGPTRLNFGGKLSEALSKASKNAGRGLYTQKLKASALNIYSPAIFSTQMTFVKGPETVSFNPNPQIDNCDVSEVTVNMSVEHNSATVVLNNRDVCNTNGKGPYTHVQGSDNFTGIKPIKIELGYEGESGDTALKQVFSGYIHKRRYIRNAGNTSQCVLECEDRSKKAKEQFACNLPFFDGWCHLAAFYYLAKEAGFTDDEILLFQDPVSGKKQRIRDLLTGDPDTFTGGCFDGHVGEKPPSAFGLDGSYLHAQLPLVLLGSQENANYNFSFGTSLWTCMMRIREFLNFYLYCNNFGNLVYGPPPLVIKDSGITFVEVDDLHNFNEIQNRLEVDFDTAYTRNMVFLQGQKFVPNKDKDGGTWVPHIHIRRKPNFPNDINDTSYAPWIRYAFIRNPKFESENLANYAANEYFRRYTRTVANCDFSAWGHPQLFPYHAITIDESVMNETGATKLSKFVIAAHTIKATTSNFQLTSDFSVETYDAISVNYEPNMIHLRE